MNQNRDASLKVKSPTSRDGQLQVITEVHGEHTVVPLMSSVSVQVLCQVRRLYEHRNEAKVDDIAKVCDNGAVNCATRPL